MRGDGGSKYQRTSATSEESVNSQPIPTFDLSKRDVIYTDFPTNTPRNVEYQELKAYNYLRNVHSVFYSLHFQCISSGMIK